MDKGRFAAYWANAGSNGLVGELIRGGDVRVKIIMEDLLSGKTFHIRMDEQVIFRQLDHKGSVVWSLLLGNLEGMNEWMNRIADESFSYFDMGGEFWVNRN